MIDRVRGGRLNGPGLVSLGLVLAVAVTACSDTDANSEVGRGSAEAGEVAAEDVMAALCESKAASARGDRQAAEDAFVDRAHDPLHDLADRLVGLDAPASAADLLRDKQAVERIVRGDDDTPGDLTAALGRLVASAHTGFEAIGSSFGRCRGRA